MCLSREDPSLRVSTDEDTGQVSVLCVAVSVFFAYLYSFSL